MQTLEAFEPLLAREPARDAAGRRDLCHEVLNAIATHRVADRPDRFEPRLKKRRRDYCGWFTKPRAEVKRMMAKGIHKKYVPFVPQPEPIATKLRGHGRRPRRADLSRERVEIDLTEAEKACPCCHEARVATFLP